jgi:hypothetical protein
MGPRFYLQVVPLTVLGVAGTAAGLRAASFATAPASIALALAIGLACFIAARTFRANAGWMALFIVGLSLAAGVVLARLGWVGGPAPAVGAAGILVLMGILSRALPKWLRLLYAPFWIAAWVLVLGSIGLWLAGGVSAWTVPLALLIALVFAGLSAAWFARLPPEPLPVAAIDLYLIGLNLFLSLGVLSGEFR